MPDHAQYTAGAAVSPHNSNDREIDALTKRGRAVLDWLCAAHINFNIKGVAVRQFGRAADLHLSHVPDLSETRLCFRMCKLKKLARYLLGTVLRPNPHAEMSTVLVDSGWAHDRAAMEELSPSMGCAVLTCQKTQTWSSVENEMYGIGSGAVARPGAAQIQQEWDGGGWLVGWFWFWFWFGLCFGLVGMVGLVCAEGGRERGGGGGSDD